MLFYRKRYTGVSSYFTLLGLSPAEGCVGDILSTHFIIIYMDYFYNFLLKLGFCSLTDWGHVVRRPSLAYNIPILGTVH